jgi:hypothetical protein
MMEGCALNWGCDAFDAARANAASCDDGFWQNAQLTATGGGFRIIQGRNGLSTVRGYYDTTTGELIGYWEMDDVGMEVCSGTIPLFPFLDPEDFTGINQLTNVEPLCLPDGGPLSALDAGDAG